MGCLGQGAPRILALHILRSVWVLGGQRVSFPMAQEAGKGLGQVDISVYGSLLGTRAFRCDLHSPNSCTRQVMGSTFLSHVP